MNAKRSDRATHLKAEIKQWRQQHSPLTSTYGSLTDISRCKQCFSCQSTQRRALASAAKIQSLSHELTRQKKLAVQLQEAKSQLQIMASTNTTMKQKILHQEQRIKQQKTIIHNLKETTDHISKENSQLWRTAGTNSSQGRRHKQTRTARPGEDVVSEGLIMYPSPKVINKLKKMRETQFMQKYIDPKGEARLTPIVKLRTNMYVAIRHRLSKRLRIRCIYTQGKGAKVDWIAEPKTQRITHSMRAKCLSTLYNCCKYGVLHWPDTDDEFDPEDTDEELLENLNEAGHSDNPEHYAHIMPEPTIWEPFMAKLKKQPHQTQSTIFRLQMDQKSPWECASTTSKIQTLKAALHDQGKLLHILKSLDIIPHDHHSEIRHDELEDIISTLQTSGKPTPSTRASKKKERVWALLPDLALGKQKISHVGYRKEIIAEKAKQQELKSMNTTKQWVIEDDDNYLLDSPDKNN